jgi:ABC-type Zn2+ transport system substrate-binding protein/surface adhesin
VYLCTRHDFGDQSSCTLGQLEEFLSQLSLIAAVLLSGWCGDTVGELGTDTNTKHQHTRPVHMHTHTHTHTHTPTHTHTHTHTHNMGLGPNAFSTVCHAAIQEPNCLQSYTVSQTNLQVFCSRTEYSSSSKVLVEWY